MVKFKVTYKGKITQLFGGNANPLYKEAGLSGHSGCDWIRGYGSPVRADNGGFVYKVLSKELGTTGPSGFTGVYTLVSMGGDNFMEILYGHLSRIYVKEGDMIPENLTIGLEGNCGDVYSQGIYYPEGAPNKGTKGSHVHEQYRPVKRTRILKGGVHYLNDTNGERYQDKDGYYYEVVNTNDVMGCVDPMMYTHNETWLEYLSNAMGVLNYLSSKVSQKPKNEL